MLHLFVLVLLPLAVEVLFYFMLIFFVLFYILLLCYVERSRVILLQISPLSTLGRDDKKLIFSENALIKNCITAYCNSYFLHYPFTNFLHG